MIHHHPVMDFFLLQKKANFSIGKFSVLQQPIFFARPKFVRRLLRAGAVTDQIHPMFFFSVTKFPRLRPETEKKNTTKPASLTLTTKKGAEMLNPWVGKFAFFGCFWLGGREVKRGVWWFFKMIR